MDKEKMDKRRHTRMTAPDVWLADAGKKRKVGLLCLCEVKVAEWKSKTFSSHDF